MARMGGREKERVQREGVSFNSVIVSFTLALLWSPLKDHIKYGRNLAWARQLLPSPHPPSFFPLIHATEVVTKSHSSYSTATP